MDLFQKFIIIWTIEFNVFFLSSLLSTYWVDTDYSLEVFLKNKFYDIRIFRRSKNLMGMQFNEKSFYRNEFQL